MQRHFFIHYLQWCDDKEAQSLTRFIEQSIQTDDDVILGLEHEAFPVTAQFKKYFNTLIETLHNKFPTIRVFVIINDAFKYALPDLMIPGVRDVLVVDFFAYQIWNYAIRLKKIPLNSHWDKNSKTLLYLGGRFKPWRLRLMYQLKQQNLLDQVNYSLYKIDAIEDDLYTAFPELEKDKTFELSNILLRTMNDDLRVDKSQELHPFLYNVKWFENSLFQVINETDFENTRPDYPWTTEKTWISIVNYRPFIIMGDVGTVAKLESEGFDTFTDLMQVPNYDTIHDPQEKIDAIVANVKGWLQDLPKHSERVQLALEHNRNQFDIKCQLIKKNIEDFIDKHNLDQHHYRTVPFIYFRYSVAWQRFYNNFKAPEWPPCDLPQDFLYLPLHVQQECMKDNCFPHDIINHCKNA